MSFHDVRLPEDVERGAKGGPRFKTSIRQLSSGHEKRNIEWEKARGEWDVGYGIQREIDLARVINFFYARLGQAHSFRFKDWSDYKLADSLCGTGNGVQTVFQCIKTYESGSYVYQRIITKPVAGLVVKLDGVVVPSGYTIDLTTGLITFSSPVANGIDVTISGTFDVHVRFNTDRLDISAESFESGAIPDISIIELKKA
jgi:uncharacterized protein (TIGR02217 family)